MAEVGSQEVELPSVLPSPSRVASFQLPVERHSSLHRLGLQLVLVLAGFHVDEQLLAGVVARLYGAVPP